MDSERKQQETPSTVHYQLSTPHLPLLAAVLFSIFASGGLAAAQDIEAEGARRFKSFVAVEVMFDDNVFSTGNPALEEEDIVISALTGGVFTANVNEGQQKYEAGGQIKLKAYAENDDLTDYEGDAFVNAAFDFNRVNFFINDRFSRTFEPTDILADRAPRLINSFGANLGYDGDRFDVRAGFQHTRRDEEERVFAALEHVDIRYGLDATYDVSDDFSIGASVYVGELDYDFDITADSFETTRISGIVSGRLPGGRWIDKRYSGIRYSARLGVILVDDKSAIDEDTTNFLAAVQVNWNSPDQANWLQVSFTSEVYPSSAVSFEVVSRTQLKCGRQFTEKLSGDISVSYEDSDRGDLVPDPTRFTWGVGLTCEIKERHEAYLSVGQVTKTSRIPNDDYDRLQVSLGVNLQF